jgi:hypothetical protein
MQTRKGTMTPWARVEVCMATTDMDERGPPEYTWFELRCTQAPFPSKSSVKCPWHTITSSSTATLRWEGYEKSNPCRHGAKMQIRGCLTPLANARFYHSIITDMHRLRAALQRKHPPSFVETGRTTILSSDDSRKDLQGPARRRSLC